MSRPVKSVSIEAEAKAIRCRSAAWGGQPCNLKGGCPFGRKTPQKPSELHCKDVTAEMWAEALSLQQLLRLFNELQEAERDRG